MHVKSDKKRQKPTIALSQMQVQITKVKKIKLDLYLKKSS